MAYIKLEIKNCSKCPFSEVVNITSTDGFDRMEDYKCNKLNRIVGKAMEWHELNKEAPLPTDCPIEIKTP